MASGKTSKNARTSKPKEFVKPVKERKKKEYILVELTQDIYKTYREDLSTYDNKPVEDIIVRYGKTYLKIKNI